MHELDTRFLSGRTLFLRTGEYGVPAKWEV